jgi:iron-sulfur cluster repair protein YtfE (RIC family)
MQIQNNEYSTNYKHARNQLTNACPSVVVESLIASHNRYRNITIPKIEQSFIGLIKIFPEIPSLAIIFKVFIKFEIAMKFHIALEEEIIFKEYLYQKNLEKPPNDIAHEEEEPFLSEIINLIKKEKCIHNPFCRILIKQLEKFDEELKHHAWIEENIIYKKIRENRMTY